MLLLLELLKGIAQPYTLSLFHLAQSLSRFHSRVTFSLYLIWTECLCPPKIHVEILIPSVGGD